MSEFLFPPAGDEPSTGKTLSALKRSREGHNAMIALFGADMLPSSVMRTKRKRVSERRDAPAAGRNHDNGSEQKQEVLADEKLPGAVRTMARKLSYRADKETSALSSFPQDVGRTVVLFYTEPGDLIVDPFAGHNSRMELCVRAGRDYIGCDVSADFMQFNRSRAAELSKEFLNRKIKLYECDSRDQPMPNGIGDGTITSPPYWDLEWYGPEDDQLGNAQTYDGFLAGLKLCMTENFRTLKCGAYSVWFVNDFRKNGKMYLYHADLWRLGQEVGFIGHDIIVVDLGVGLRDVFVNEAVRCRVIPKRHEYAVVFRKP